MNALRARLYTSHTQTFEWKSHGKRDDGVRWLGSHCCWWLGLGWVLLRRACEHAARAVVECARKYRFYSPAQGFKFKCAVAGLRQQYMYWYIARVRCFTLGLVVVTQFFMHFLLRFILFGLLGWGIFINALHSLSELQKEKKCNETICDGKKIEHIK